MQLLLLLSLIVYFETVIQIKLNYLLFQLESTNRLPEVSFCLSSAGAILGRSETQECVLFSSSWEKDRSNHSGTEDCIGEKDKRRHCFATWKNVSGTIEIIKQGCWLDDMNCYDRYAGRPSISLNKLKYCVLTDDLDNTKD